MTEATSAATSSYNPNFPPLFHHGLPAIGTFALISVLATVSLFGFISYRMVTWRQHYRTFVGYNQYIVLVYNLALADLMQACSFIISWHWLQRGEIDSDSNWCFGQGFLVHIGDVSSAFFILAIALHTWFRVVRNREMPYNVFLGVVAFIWCFAGLLTILAPILKGKHVFVQSGAWCWINEEYETDRLALHYAWVFIVEFGSFLIYVWIFYYLLNYQRRNGLRDFGQMHANAKKLVWASRAMLAYPVVYTMFTIPLAGGRMASYAGHNIPDVYWIAAGCFMTSCGWVDALIYTLTRRVLLKQELSTNNGTFQNMPNTPITPRGARGHRIRNSIGALGKVFSTTQGSSSEDLESKLSGKGVGVTVTCESASDELELKAFDEVAVQASNNAPVVRVQTPPPTRKHSKNRSPTTSGNRSPERRAPFSISRMYFNNRNNANNEGNENGGPGNTAHVETGGFTRIRGLDAGGIMVTSHIEVDNVRASEFRARSDGESWAEKAEFTKNS